MTQTEKTNNIRLNACVLKREEWQMYFIRIKYLSLYVIILNQKKKKRIKNK